MILEMNLFNWNQNHVFPLMAIHPGMWPLCLQNKLPGCRPSGLGLKITKVPGLIICIMVICLLLASPMKQKVKKCMQVCVCVHLHGVDSIPDNTQHIKTGHDWLRQVNVLSKG